MPCDIDRFRRPVRAYRLLAVAAVLLLAPALTWCSTKRALQPTTTSEFQRCMRLGVSLSRGGQREAAKRSFERSVALRPKDPAARGWFGRSLVESVQFVPSYQVPTVACATLQRALDEFVAVLSLSDHKADVARAAFYVRLIAGLLPRYAIGNVSPAVQSHAPQAPSRVDLIADPDAVIELRSADGTLYSRAGALALNGLPPGPYQLTVRRSGRKAISRRLVLGAGETRREHLRPAEQTK